MNTDEKYDRFRKNRPIDIVNIGYLMFIFSIYTFRMHNKYFDITGTRASTFIYGTLIYVILIAAAFAIEYVMMKYYQPDGKFFFNDAKFYQKPEFWMVLFLVANVFAFLMSEDKAGSWTGETGRRFGLGMIIVLTLMIILLSKEAFVNEWLFVLIVLASATVFILAYVQHFGMDPFELRIKIVAKQKEMFISSFGNINTYASFICVVLPMFVAAFTFSGKLWIRVVAAIITIMAGAAIIPAKSDNVYLGLGVAFIVLFYVAVLNKRLIEYMFSALLLFVGLEIMAILNSAFSGSRKHLNGIAEIVENPKIMFVLLLFVLLVTAAVLVFRKTNLEKYQDIQSWNSLLAFSLILAVSIVGVIAVGIKTKNSFFVFNDKWGTFRGYIWRRGVSLFKIASPMQKIFGYGNETIGELMQRYYYEEMVDITGKKYDNLHNELLQYLVTTGIFGLITYLGFVSSSFIYIGKRMKDNPVLIACLASGVAYFVQSLVNLNQPITTPYFFVVLATGIGYSRFLAERKDIE